jgi:hypothetical protein
MSYGIDIVEVHRQVGLYVGQILKGAKPAELPIMLPTKFEFVINLKQQRPSALKSLTICFHSPTSESRSAASSYSCSAAWRQRGRARRARSRRGCRWSGVSVVHLPIHIPRY